MKNRLELTDIKGNAYVREISGVLSITVTRTQVEGEVQIILFKSPDKREALNVTLESFKKSMKGKERGFVTIKDNTGKDILVNIDKDLSLVEVAAGSFRLTIYSGEARGVQHHMITPDYAKALAAELGIEMPIFARLEKEAQDAALAAEERAKAKKKAADELAAKIADEKAKLLAAGDIMGGDQEADDAQHAEDEEENNDDKV